MCGGQSCVSCVSYHCVDICCKGDNPAFHEDKMKTADIIRKHLKLVDEHLQEVNEEQKGFNATKLTLAKRYLSEAKEHIDKTDHTLGMVLSSISYEDMDKQYNKFFELRNKMNARKNKFFKDVDKGGDRLIYRDVGDF